MAAFSLKAGGHSDLVLDWVCSSSLKTLHIFKGHFVLAGKVPMFTRDFSQNIGQFS